jgi:hypothetical protein
LRAAFMPGRPKLTRQSRNIEIHLHRLTPVLKRRS